MEIFFLKLILVAVLIVMSGIFSGTETALMSLSRLHLARLQKVHPGRLLFWEADPDRVLAVILLGNNLVNAGLGVLATFLALDLERDWGVAFGWGGWLVPAIVVVITIIFGEIVPKVLARNFPETVALRLAGLFRALTFIGGPVMLGVVRATSRLLSLVSQTIKTEQAEWNVSIITRLLDQSSLALPLRSVLKNLLDFGNLPVQKVMIPRQAVFAVDLGLPKDRFIDRVLSSGYSRVPVYKGSLDNVAGIVYAKDLLASWRSESLIVVEDLIRPAFHVAPATPLAHILREFRQGRHHMALVLDHHNRVQGVVTLQDILESIVGEIREEPGLLLDPSTVSSQ